MQPKHNNLHILQSLGYLIQLKPSKSSMQIKGKVWKIKSHKGQEHKSPRLEMTDWCF